ncbi:DUF3833 domain-containing protein [Pseudoduganella violaceinigra]|uniref:DUF3833 domain-containing protein n=1 Tax=Pseudoduganella violaceinigra TaxID=246602 RepID=UPI000483D7C1|nr:DUF3833 domain-containing protein [Pseudoduganella violaceinigra]
MKKLAICLALLLAACAGNDVHQYAPAQPKLDVAEFFAGTTDAWGMFQKRNGDVVKRFRVEIEGSRDGDSLRLDERFKYDDGSSQRRIWRLVPQAQGRWQGTAADVKGEAYGEVAGNALRWRYTMLLPVDGSTYEMHFDDWMFLIDECTMINRATMRKFGIELGQVTLMFRKRSCSP